MQKKNVAPVSDEEIRGLMDFDRLVVKASRMAYVTKLLGKLKLITGGLAAVSVSVFLIWNAENTGVSTYEEAAPSRQPALPPPADKAAASDSAGVTKQISVQRLPSMNVQPKKKAAAALEKKEGEQPAQAATTSAASSSVVYREAEPVEGFPHLYEYFGTELKYPEEAIEDSIQGLVTVTFIIDGQGKVGKISIFNSLGSAFDAEAIRLVNNMPAWKPATIDGKPVVSKFSLPLNFQLERSKQ